MDHAELSLGLPGSMLSESTSSASTESDAIAKRKRKLQTWDHGIDLHLSHPLPLEWEQCLDLQVNTFSLSLPPSLPVPLLYHTAKWHLIVVTLICGSRGRCTT